LQRYVVLGDDRKILITNNIVLQIIPREYNFDFRHRTGGAWEATGKCPDRPHFVAGIASFWNDWSFYGERINIMNMSWAKITFEFINPS
jgi:hypothetical protein